jgi:hypothetical protein
MSECRAYLLFLWIELDELLEEDDEERDTDHAYEADTYARETAQVRLRVVVTVAHSCHRHETHPEGVHEVAEVLGVACESIRLLTRLYNKCSHDTHNHHH